MCVKGGRESHSEAPLPPLAMPALERAINEKKKKIPPCCWCFSAGFALRALAVKAPVPRLTIKHAVSLRVILRRSSRRENLFFVTKSLILSSPKKEGNTKNVSNLL